MTRTMTPAELARYDQKLESAVRLTMSVAAELDHLPMPQATKLLAEGLMAQGLDRHSMATAAAALAIRLYRRTTEELPG